MRKSIDLLIVVNGIFIGLGVLVACFSIRSFLLPNHFIDGGITGISMLCAEFFNFPLSIILFCMNLPFVYLGFKKVSIRFAVFGFVGILFFSICLHFFPYIYVTQDRLLGAVFGGIFLGMGIGLSIRGGGVLDGSEILAIVLSKKLGVTVGNVLIFVNVIIFSFGAFFLGIENAMYSVLVYLCASKSVNFIIYGIEEFVSVMVMSSKIDAIKDIVLHDFRRGATILQAKGGYHNTNQPILMCVVTQYELEKLKVIVYEKDRDAFLLTHKVNEYSGGHIKRIFKRSH
ncbi:YitT family protein [bacterium]|nr:YitT family protein [bacterium]